MNLSSCNTICKILFNNVLKGERSMMSPCKYHIRHGKFIAIFVNQIQLYMLKVKRLCEIKPTMSRAVLSLSEAKSQACTYKNH